MHLAVVKGAAKVMIGETKWRVGKYQTIYVAVGKKHLLENETESDLVLVEVQNGACVEEDRFEDVYAGK